MAIVAAVLCAAPLLSSCASNSLPSGPLFESSARSPNAYVYRVDGPQMEFTDGFTTFAALDDDDVVIESIRSIGDSDDVTVVGTLLSGPLGENGTFQSFEGFPPREGLDGETIEASGALIAARSGHYQILIGYRGVLGEISVRTGVEVTYRVGTTQYRDVLPAGIVMCPEDEDQACSDEMNRLVDGFLESR